MTLMHVAFVLIGLAGLLGTYDMARRMSWKTRHGIRFAVIVIGIACVLTMSTAFIPDLTRSALLTLLIGCGLYRLFDKRAEGWNHGRNDPRAAGFAPTQPLERDPHELGPGFGHAMGGGVHLQVVRQDAVRRRA